MAFTSAYSRDELASMAADADDGEDYWEAKVIPYVEGGHTLLLKHPMERTHMILAGKPQLGGRDWMDGTCYPNPANLRPATRADFEAFRVAGAEHYFGEAT